MSKGYGKAMDKLVIASNNPGKIREIAEILGGYFGEAVSLREAGLNVSVTEDGETFEENALKKAREVAARAGCFALADDSGLCVDALCGAPGVYSARFAGEMASDEENNEKLMQMMQNVPEGRRGAHYACVMALSGPGGDAWTAYGEVQGQIALQPRGNNGFGYDPFFYLPEYGCTMAELPPDVKNRISHRYHALQALKQKLGE